VKTVAPTRANPIDIKRRRRVRLISRAARREIDWKGTLSVQRLDSIPEPADKPKNEERWFGRVALRFANRKNHKFSARDLCVYIQLCGHAHKNGACCVRMEIPAGECWISSQHVADSIRRLEKAGEVETRINHALYDRGRRGTASTVGVLLRLGLAP
jgi:hypothetical protein